MQISITEYKLIYVVRCRSTNNICKFKLRNSAVWLQCNSAFNKLSIYLVVALKRQKMLRNGELGETRTGQNQRSALRQDLKIVRMLLIVVGVFFFCWLPFSITRLVLIYKPERAFDSWSMRLHVIMEITANQTWPKMKQIK